MPDPVDTAIEIETPEHVRFRHDLAGPTRRALAYLVDLAARVLVLGVIIALFVAGLGDEGMSRGPALASSGLVMVVLFALEWLYFVLYEWISGGRTFGKRLFRLRVVLAGGQPPGLIECVLRNLLRAADFLPFGYAIGLCVCMVDGRFRRLGDLVAGTMVVHDRESAVPRRRRAPRAPEYDALPARPTVSVEEAEALVLFTRRDDVSDARRAELATLIAPHFAARFGLASYDPVRLLEALQARLEALHG